MSHSKCVFSKLSNLSRSVPDYDRVVNYDENGVERITYELVDYPRIQQSLGSFDKWSLMNLMAAGVDPRFNIRTGFNTGLDAHNAIMAGIAGFESVVESEKKAE